MDIYELAGKFGRKLVETEEFLNLRKAEIALENSPRDKEIFNKYIKFKSEGNSSISQSEMEKIEVDARSIELIDSYLKAQEQYNKVLEKSKDIIEHFTDLSINFSLDGHSKSTGCSKGCNKCCSSKM